MKKSTVVGVNGGRAIDVKGALAVTMAGAPGRMTMSEASQNEEWWSVRCVIEMWW
jgi:hypothetical protein